MPDAAESVAGKRERERERESSAWTAAAAVAVAGLAGGLAVAGGAVALGAPAGGGGLVAFAALAAALAGGPLAACGALGLRRADEGGSLAPHLYAVLVAAGAAVLAAPPGVGAGERLLLYGARGALAGAWMGTAACPLDWGRPWQAWPTPQAWGAASGFLLGILVSAVALSRSSGAAPPRGRA